ncbi:MAG: methanobactin biosynthesis cassette protein MbnB [Gallionella sp.]|nr:methanobactin biosynthesis cassette protein MbnB [Gallionella sp.]
MLIGLNFTLGGTLELVQRLAKEGEIDYCELLIDNFLQVPPSELRDAFACPIGLHIMFSKFLESDAAYLESMAERLREYIDVLKPLYISDHLARFTHKGRTLYHLAELDYPNEYHHVRQRVDWWQEKLGQRLYLENYPSIMDGGHDAPEFFERLVQDTGAGVLFDASNAVCAQLNCGLGLDRWLNVIDSTTHFHVAGYSLSILEPKVVLDTHDVELSPETLAFLTRYKDHFDKPNATMTYERDENIEYDDIVSDLRKLRAIFGHPKGGTQ